MKLALPHFSVQVWNRQGDFTRAIGRDDRIDAVFGNDGCLMLAGTAPSPVDPNSTVLAVDVLAKFPTQSLGTYMDETVTRYDECIANDKWMVLVSGNFQELQVLDVKTRKLVSKRSGSFIGASLMPEHDLIMAISADDSQRHLVLLEPNSDLVVHSIPLSLAAVMNSDFLEASTAEKTKWNRVKVYVLGEENVRSVIEDLARVLSHPSLDILGRQDSLDSIAVQARLLCEHVYGRHQHQRGEGWRVRLPLLGFWWSGGASHFSLTS